MGPQEYVYLMRSGRVYKIGRSNKPLRRLIELGADGRRYSDERMVIVHTIASNNARTIERQLKQVFRKWREHGEWFRLPPGAADWICRQSDPLENAPSFDARSNRQEADRLLTPRAAAAFIGIEERAVRHWMSTGGIECVSFRWGTKRIKLSEARRIKEMLDN